MYNLRLSIKKSIILDAVVVVRCSPGEGVEDRLHLCKQLVLRAAVVEPEVGHGHGYKPRLWPQQQMPGLRDT